MAEHRPLPPSARRLGLARAAGLQAASPVAVGALACGAILIAALALGDAAAARLGAWIAAACDGTTPMPTARGLVASVLELALPVLVAAALVAALAHLVQTRAVWLPRRPRLPGAPAATPDRAARAGVELGAAVVIGLVTLGWLWAMAPRLAALTLSPRAGGLMIGSFVAALAVAWVALGALDALVRHLELASALRMSPAERREDERLAGPDRRWRTRRGELARGPSTRDAVAGASVLVLGDGLAVAIAWDPVRRPVPVRTATGRAARATQLLGLARRHGVAVHREPELAAALVDGEGPVPIAHWARLAEIIAATRGRRTRS